MLQALQQVIQSFGLQCALWGINLSLLLQIVAVVTVATFGYRWLLQRSPAAPLIKVGVSFLFGLIGVFVVALYFNLHLLTTVMGFCIQMMIVVLIVVFQPELRRVLLILGQSDRFRVSLGNTPTLQSNTPISAITLVRQLCDSAKFLSKTRTGGLIVLEGLQPLENSTLEVGTRLEAMPSTELILTLFHQNTPLHDGALVIDSQHRLLAAGVLLPLTEDPKLSWQYGTRHRAALGLSERCDCTCLVISEETGMISWVEQGQLEKLQGVDELRKRLEKRYKVNASEKPATVLAMQGHSPASLIEPKTLAEQFFQWMERRTTTADNPGNRASEGGSRPGPDKRYKA